MLRLPFRVLVSLQSGCAMPQSDAELFAIARRAFEAFGHLPHVHAVGVGGRERNGQPTGEIVLAVCAAIIRRAEVDAELRAV